MNVKLIVLISLLSIVHSRRARRRHFAKPGSVPYQVSIQKVINNVKLDGQHYCGAAIVDDKWALTTGHCATEINKPNRMKDFVIVAGKIFSLIYESAQQTREIDSVYIHKNYLEQEVREISVYDIGLIKANESFIFNKLIAPIALPKENEKVGKEAVVSGWSFIHNRDMRRFKFLPWLEYTTLKILKTKTCISAVQNISSEIGILLQTKEIEENIICAGPLTTVKVVCIADSGGPLVRKKRFGRQTIIGILSYIKSYFQGPYRDGVSVYVKILPYVHWIKTIMNKQ